MRFNWIFVSIVRLINACYVCTTLCCVACLFVYRPLLRIISKRVPFSNILFPYFCPEINASFAENAKCVCILFDTQFRERERKKSHVINLFMFRMSLTFVCKMTLNIKKKLSTTTASTALTSKYTMEKCWITNNFA